MIREQSSNRLSEEKNGYSNRVGKSNKNKRQLKSAIHYHPISTY